MMYEILFIILLVQYVVMILRNRVIHITFMLSWKFRERDVQCLRLASRFLVQDRYIPFQLLIDYHRLLKFVGDFCDTFFMICRFHDRK